MKKIRTVILPSMLCVGIYISAHSIMIATADDQLNTTTSTADIKHTESSSIKPSSSVNVSLTETHVDNVTIPDETFKKVILSTLGKPLGSEITKEDMAKLTSLQITAENSAKISNLSGLEYAINLVDFYLSSSGVTDFSPLEKLSSLVYVNLSGKNLNSSNFPDLSLSANGITHISASNASLDNDVLPKLAQLSQVERLYLDTNMFITTLEPLKVMPKLRSISVQFCGITDFTVINDFPVLNDLAAFGQNTGRANPPMTINRTDLAYDAETQTVFLPFTLMPNRMTNFDGYVPPFTTSNSSNETQLEFNGTRLPENRLQITDQGITVSDVTEDEYVNLSNWEYNSRINNPAGSYQSPANYSFYSISSGTYLQQFNVIDEPEEGAPITVEYLDEAGIEIDNATILTGKIDTPFQTAPKEINGWILKTTPDNEVGFFSQLPQTVTYTYEKALGAPVTVKYLDETGTEIEPSTTLSGKIDTPFKTVPKEINQWMLKTTPTNEAGSFKQTAQEVVYIYEKAFGAPVTIHYLDDEGHRLADSDVLTGRIDAPFDTTPKQINHWQLNKKPENTSGLFTSQPQTLVYIYNRSGILPVASFSQFGENSHSESNSISQLVDQKQFSGEPLIQTILPSTLQEAQTDYKQTKKNNYKTGSVTVKFVDDKGNELATSRTLKGEIGASYKVTAKSNKELMK
ncbi:MucBP domain-containing protein [Enterococcus sp. 5H]|uniref:MucBP domain-containing protein n=1 Tax=Enterococcus sp. 5H TaxID=1229490 RepID=UPI002303ABC8|nr:MucBP domain-containing protein [Enterococcus sp. 5H]